LLELGLELVGVRAAGLQNLSDFGSVHDGQQQVLDRHEFVAGFASARECVIQTKFKFLT
jgi:hypothetical protein